MTHNIESITFDPFFLRKRLSQPGHLTQVQSGLTTTIPNYNDPAGNILIASSCNDTLIVNPSNDVRSRVNSRDHPRRENKKGEERKESASWRCGGMTTRTGSLTCLHRINLPGDDKGPKSLKSQALPPFPQPPLLTNVSLFLHSPPFHPSVSSPFSLSPASLNTIPYSPFSCFSLFF